MKTKIGQKVWYYPIRGESKRYATAVRSEPWALGHGAMVVKVNGIAGGVSVLHLEPRDGEPELKVNK